MAYFGSSFADAPVLAISPQTAQQAIALSKSYSAEASSPMNAKSCASESRYDAPPPPPQRPSGAGRKRSRDEADLNVSEDLSEPTPIEPIKETEDDWIYGEGMVLIKPGTGYVADASSQSGTWVEEKAAAEEEARKAAYQRQLIQRPALRSAKSQRLEAVAGSPGKEYSVPSPSTSVCNVDVTSPPPIVDDFTVHLGIGWRRISEDDHIQAAARGWAKYIENHYPLTNVAIRLESKGLQSYLVEAAEGYFLFDEGLRQGRLVSVNGEGALSNLKQSPPIFDGAVTMMAAETPRAVDGAATPIFPMDMEMEVC
jgi:hypothetical protein